MASVLSALVLLSLLCLSFGSYTMKSVMEIKKQQWAAAKSEGLLGAEHAMSIASVVLDPQPCVDGELTAGGTTYPCDNVDFLSMLSVADLSFTNPVSHVTDSMADVWGWTSPDNEEITIACTDNGVVFVGGTDPTNPEYLGWIPSGRGATAWCDVKVYQNTAYIVRDGDGPEDYGIEVFNLTRLAGLTGTPVELTTDFVYTEHGNSHNLVINPDSGFLYSVGSDTCSGGLHMIDLNTDPLEPVFAGCADEDGYTHDAQCVVYDGPDTDYTGKEICFAFNEDTVTIYDVTNKTNATILSTGCYPEVTYTHQGWVSDDLTMLFVDDELDEFCTYYLCETSPKRQNTVTYYFNISDLDSITFQGFFTHPTIAVDHNLYIWGSMLKRGWTGSAPVANHPSVDYAYMANYGSGLRVCDISQADQNIIQQSGFFDVSPSVSTATFMGAWSTYMHPSGVIALTSIETGLFFLNFTQAFTAPASQITLETAQPGSECTVTITPPPTDSLVTDLLLGLGVGIAVAIVVKVAHRYYVVQKIRNNGVTMKM